MDQPRIFISEIDYSTLNRTNEKSGIFNPVDRDDVKSAKKLAEGGLFEPVMQRQLSGRNKTVYRLTDQGREVFAFRRGMIRKAFADIASKSAADMAAD
jgi:hypothetical protein